MADIPTLVVTPTSAAGAYARADQFDAVKGGTDNGFDATLQRAIHGAIGVAEKADAQTMQAISGGGNLTQVVTAVAQAQLTLQTATVIRDRVVQAYQDIIKMPI